MNQDIVHNDQEKEIVNEIKEIVEDVYNISDDVGFQTTERYVRLVKLHELAEDARDSILQVYEGYEMNDSLKWHVGQIGHHMKGISDYARLLLDEVEYTVMNRSFEIDGEMDVDDSENVKMMLETMIYSILLFTTVVKEHIELLTGNNEVFEKSD